MDAGKLRVLIITSLYPPDVAANAKRMHQLAETLKSHGHQVTVLAAVPHYPHGRIHGRWRRRPFHVSLENDIKVIRVLVFAAPGRKLWQQALNYCSFFAMSLFSVPLVGLGNDVIITISPPLLSGFSASVYSALCRSPFVFDVQDLYPETAVQLGMLKGKKSIAFFEAMERLIYRRAAMITVISDGFRKSLRTKGVTADKIKLMPNWADTDRFSPFAPAVDRKYLGLDDRFVILFLGTVGRAQGCEVILEAASLLKNRHDIGFCLIGDGVARKALEAETARRKLDNIKFINPVSHDEVPEYLAAADACLVHLVKNNLYKITIPSKTYEYMAAGKPVLMGVDGEAATLIEDSGSGLCFSPEEPHQLAEAALRLAEDPDLCEELGENGRAYCLKHFSQDRLLSNYEKMIQDLVQH